MITSLEPLRSLNLLKLCDIDVCKTFLIFIAYNKIQSLCPVFKSSLPSLAYFNLCKILFKERKKSIEQSQRT